MQVPQSSFLNLENLREKNFWGEGQEPCPALTTPRARGDQEVAQDCVWEVGQLVTGGVEKQVGKVPFLGNHSWSQLDTSSEEGPHYKGSVLISKQTAVPEGRACVRASRRDNFAPRYVPPPLKPGFSQPPRQ